MPRRAALSCLAAVVVSAAVLTVPAHAAVIERFSANPLTSQGANPFFLEGNIDGHFAYLPEAPPHFPGDREGTLRVIYDTTVTAARIATPLGQVLSLNDDFSFGAILTIRSQGFSADPAGFSQISFGLWNSATTGINRTSFPSDSFDLVEFDYFPNVSPDFGGPFLSPSVFGGNVGGNAFVNFTFGSSEVPLPFDVPLLCQLNYSAATHQLKVTVSRSAGGFFFTPIAIATTTVDLSTIQPTFLLDSLGIAAYFEGSSSLHADVDYDLLYSGPLPVPFGVVARKVRIPSLKSDAVVERPRIALP